jgi:hypothetical protein
MKTATDLDNYMTSVELMYPKFKFLGVYPCDFYSNGTLHGLHKKTFIYNKLAIILNTGREYTLGEHWVGLCFDTIKQEIFYYDSGGSPPTQCIQIYINRLLNSDFSDYKFGYNTIVDQTSKEGCGIYTVNYIQNWLKVAFK